jgi:capsular polysaccharide export protein
MLVAACLCAVALRTVMLKAAEPKSAKTRLFLLPHRIDDRMAGQPRGSDSPVILLLQGPVGPFFKVFQKDLTRSNICALKVNFNGGDWLFCHGPHTLNFCGTLQAWVSWIEAFLHRMKPVAIVLFGDSRPYHIAAIEAAHGAGVPVWCLEEGYARPHFITCELGGNNALSPLRQAPIRETWLSDEPTLPVTGNLFRAMALHAMAYYFAKALCAPFFFGNLYHRNRSLASEILLWVRGFWRKIAFYHANHTSLQYLIENLESRYFVVALQVHDDLQLIRHGNGWTMERLITETVQSFAAYAESGRHLVIKVHPMDRGHRSYREFAATVATACQCADRLHIVDDGSIGLLIRHSLGVITVNSTSGLLALNHGKPLLVLGQAVYGQRRLSTLGGSTEIDRFWSAPLPPDGRAVDSFNKRMFGESLVNGNFYSRNWLVPTSKKISRRITEHLAAEAVDGFARRAS